MLTRAVLLWPLLLLAGCMGESGQSQPKTAVNTAVKTDFTKSDDAVFTPADWPKALAADIYVPKGTGPWPAVLMVYGGSWSSADHRRQMGHIARKLAGRGYVVMNASYRGAPDFRYPAPVDDLREAVRWLRTHAATYHVNPQRVGAWGFSAGGHLVALLGTLDGPPEVRVQAVVAESAPTDLTLFSTGEILPRFLGATFAEKPELYVAASPLTYVSADDPPFFLFHGTADKTVSPVHAKRFAAALARNGVRHELRWIEERGHGSMLFFNGAAENAAIDFLDSVLRTETSGSN